MMSPMASMAGIPVTTDCRHPAGAPPQLVPSGITRPGRHTCGATPCDARVAERREYDQLLAAVTARAEARLASEVTRPRTLRVTAL